MEETGIDTDIEIPRFLPCQIRITIRESCSGYRKVVEHITVGVHLIYRLIGVVGDILVTQYTVGASQFEITHVIPVVFHQTLFRYSPGSREGRKETPSVLSGEFGRPVITERYISVVFIPIIIAYTSEQ